MKVTKLVHSCLLVETGDINVLVDPGIYAAVGKQLSSLQIEKLDFIVVTHDHQDHFYLPALKQLSDRYPHAKIITNTELAAKIKSAALPNEISISSQDGIEVFEASHEPIAFDRPVPRNIGIHISGKLTHPGDSLHFDKTCPVLALPVTAPWSSLKQSLERVVEIKPKKIIPVHDWYWHKEARREQYAMTAKLIQTSGIEVISLENMDSVEIED